MLSGNADSPCILLAEDYQANVLVATTYLDSFGYMYDVAGNGHEALARMNSRHYDAVLMDVEMPGMDGLTATKIIREQERGGKRRSYIIGMTAHALIGDRQKCIEAGMDDYISKPFNPEDLRDRLARLLESA